MLSPGCSKKGVYDYSSPFLPSLNTGLQPPLRCLWKTRLPSAVTIQPQLIDHFLIVPDGYKQMEFIDPAQGKVFHKLKLGGTICHPILITDDMAVIAVSKTLKSNLTVYQLRQNKTLFKGRIRKEISSMFAVDSMAYIQDDKNYLHRLDLKRFTLTRGNQWPGRIIAPPIIRDNRVYGLTENGFVIIWDPITQRIIRQQELRQFFRHPILVHENRLWVFDLKGGIHILEPDSLQVIRRDTLPFPPAIAPIADGDRIMLVLDDHSVMSYTDQTIRHHHQFPERISSIQAVDSSWLISTLSGKIQLWDNAIQNLIWETHTTGMIATAPLRRSSRIFFFTSDRNAFCYGSE